MRDLIVQHCSQLNELKEHQDKESDALEKSYQERINAATDALNEHEERMAEGIKKISLSLKALTDSVSESIRTEE
jgi:hypothetical protein